MLDYQAVKNWEFGDIRHTYTRRDTMLYALGIGMGSNPLDPGELRFVFEKDLQAVPTMVSVIGTPGFWWKDPRTGADWVKLVHGEQRIELLKPLPVEATVVARNKVVSLTDKGPGKGAVAVIQREIFDETGTKLAVSTQVVFLRGDGGFSEVSGVGDPGPEALPAVPERAPDVEVDLPILEQAALIYRLSGDDNVLHADPEVAKAAGFPRPILHGLCTFGMAAHAVLGACCGFDASRLRSFSTRFTSPVYPGETVRFEMWNEGGGFLRLRARVEARDVTVLNNGVIELAD
ncbi:MaoC/PaaZ C-terminal domain-containing protein [Aromatoleum petrolei]|uniref:3-alpha,7-alpha, 12-alpha-trihydroxy-5-beta-cholest-24-enoyl-CoA hydratase n=1 Tax=Aromatoleum petrolei TaxID=76116 RepID=A0ABX1MLF3_9RHOO|nr:MaoC/PaaZ C-terminal domain-containing protein [Aromatoleum petrolei]NMF88563.1 3-alpha,7-alpha,12-alpha-trihydroxy-5-beta-cholest-24-enoyl-CoA hydratase [Aromatoleum petrolei]QTQ34729.1 MaoC-like dehydratase [Aromatoleum petrolei]